MKGAVLVSGANRGIGLAIVQALLESDHPRAPSLVYLGSRSLEKGRAAVASLPAEEAARRRERSVEVVQLDVTDPASVRAAADHVRGRQESGVAPPLLGLVNNAGGFVGETKDDGTLVFDVRGCLDLNVYGLKAVTEAFLPLLRNHPEGGRIVNVSSAAGPMYVAKCDAERKQWLTSSTVTWKQCEDLMAELLSGRQDVEGDGGMTIVYGLAKAVVNCYTMILARENPALRINAITPGFIETETSRAYARSKGKTPEEMGMKPPSAGTVAPLHCLLEDLEGNGRYYGSDGKRSPLDRYRAPGDPPYKGP